jgi:hypothetical protein
MSKVMKSRRTENGIIIHEHDDGTSKQYVAVRGGLSWPRTEENLPGYYLIMGEELIPAAQRKENQRGKLRVMSEFEAPDIVTSLTSLFTKLTDDSTLYLCDTFYTVTGKFEGEDYSGYTEAFRKFIYDKKIAAHLEEAPWADRSDLGIDYIQSWRDKCLLELEKGILYDQLGKVTNSNVKQIAETFNAVNALRYVVCGFEKYRPTNTNSNWRSKMRKGTWRSV